MVDQESSYKVVIVRVQVVFTPALSLEALEEIMAFEDLGAVSSGAARHTGGAAIDVVGGRDLKVSTLDVSRTKPVVDSGGQAPFSDSPHPLARTNAANLGIFEGGQQPGHQSRGPLDVVVGHDDEGGLDVVALQRLADLKPLVCLIHIEDFNFRFEAAGGAEGRSEPFQGLELVPGGYENQFCRLARENAFKGGPQVGKVIVDCGNDDRDIVRGIPRPLRNWLGLVSPVADAVAYEANISMKPNLSFSLTLVGRYSVRGNT